MGDGHPMDFSVLPGYVYSDREFKNRIHCVSNTLDMCAVPGEITIDDIRSRKDAESMILMQISSPLLTSLELLINNFKILMIVSPVKTVLLLPFMSKWDFC